MLVNGDFEAFDQNWLQLSNHEDDPLITRDFPHGGSYSAFLGYYGDVEEHLWQQVTIPASAGSVNISYWKHVLSDDESSQPTDFMYAQIRAANNTDVLRTLETINNRSTRDTWQQSSFDVTAYKGQTINVHFMATTDVAGETNFFIDDISLKACP